MKQRWGNLEQLILHMVTCWVDPKPTGGARDCVFMTVMKLNFLQLGGATFVSHCGANCVR